MARPVIELVLDAEVETPGPQAPDPGHAHAISITRYRVLRVLRGRCLDPVVLVGHDRADMTAPELLRGSRKRLDLTSRFPPGTTQLNPFRGDHPALPAYYCVASAPIEDAE